MPDWDPGLLFVGIGNAFRGDDGVGPWIAEALGAQGLKVHVHAGDGTGLIDLFEANRDIVMFDATRSRANAGTVIRFDAALQKLPAELFHYSTHRFGLAEAVETARALGGLPKRLVVYGIEGGDFEAGTKLSPPVEAAARALVETIAETYSASRANAASAG